MFKMEHSTGLDSIFSWFIALCGCFYCTFTVGFFVSSGVLFVLIQDRYDVTKEMASYPINGLTSAQSIFGIFSGAILHRLKTRKTLILSSCLGVLGSCMATFNPLKDPIVWLTFCMAIRGIGASLAYPVIIQAVSSHFSRHRGKAFMVLSLFVPLGGLILPSCVRISAENYGLQSSWLIHASIYSQTILLALLVKPRQVDKKIQEEQIQLFDQNKQNQETQKDLDEKPKIQSEESLYFKLKTLLREKAFHVLWIAHLIIMLSNLSFRTTVLDYGRDIGLNPDLNKYILEIMSFCDVVRIPVAIAIDKRYVYEETILTLASFLAALCLVLLTQTSNAIYVVVICVYSVSYAMSAAVIYPIFATLGSDKLALSFGLAMGVYGLVQLGLPSLIGLFRDIYGTYDYLFYLFSFLNIILMVVLATSRVRRWFNHRKL